MNIRYLFLLLIFLNSCAGTGTKSLSMINLNVDSDETAAFFVRKKRFVASAGLVKIQLDSSFPDYILNNKEKYKNWIL